MKNDEVLLTNYPYILKLINIGVSIKKIVYQLEKFFDIKVTYRELLYLIERVRTGKIHPEYNNIIVINADKIHLSGNKAATKDKNNEVFLNIKSP